MYLAYEKLLGFPDGEVEGNRILVCNTMRDVSKDATNLAR